MGDNEKIKVLEDYIASALKAEEWYKALDLKVVTSWSQLVTEFNK